MKISFEMLLRNLVKIKHFYLKKSKLGGLQSKLAILKKKRYLKRKNISKRWPSPGGSFCPFFVNIVVNMKFHESASINVFYTPDFLTRMHVRLFLACVNNWTICSKHHIFSGERLTAVPIPGFKTKYKLSEKTWLVQKISLKTASLPIELAVWS